MHNDYKKILSAIREHSTLHDLVFREATSDEVKKAIFALLTPYLSKSELLERFGLGLLVPDAVTISKIHGIPWAKGMLRSVINWHRNVIQAGDAVALAVYGDWEPEVQKGISKWWSVYYLESDKSRLALEEFVLELSRNIGAVIEGCLQPLLRELLNVMLVGRGRRTCKKEIMAIDLGKVIEELIEITRFPALFSPPPWRIRINQWRNMCQHFDLVVDGEQIIGSYGRQNKRKIIHLTRQQFFNVGETIVLIFNIVKQARSLIILDNSENMAANFPDIELRPEQGILCIASAVVTQGFELEDFQADQKSVQATIRDLTAGDPHSRMLHASQFVCFIWAHFPRDIITVIYKDIDGKRWLTTKAAGCDCQAVSEGKVPFEELAKRVRLIPER